MSLATVEDITFTGEIHPAAEAWPLLPDDELAELGASIAEIGLTDPITLDPAGRLLDGRNRLNACKLAGVEPEFVIYDGDPVPFIIAKNADRRHMTNGAKAMTTAVVLADAGYRKNGRWKYGALSESTGSGGFQNRLREAGLVLDFAPSLASAVIAGDKSLDAARKEAEEVKNRSDSDTERMDSLKSEAADLAAKVKAGEFTLAEAEAVLKTRKREHAEAVKRHGKYLTESINAWDHLVAIAENRFPHFDEAVEQIPESFRERLTEAARVIRKGLK